MQNKIATLLPKSFFGLYGYPRCDVADIMPGKGDKEMHSPSLTAPVSPDAISVLIVDDHALLSESLVAALQRTQDFLATAVPSIDAAEALIKEHGRFSAVLADYGGPGMSGIDGLMRLINANKGSVALFSGVVGWPTAERAIAAGASGFIPKTLHVKTLGHAIRFIADGEVYLPLEFMLRQTEKEYGEFDLKPRELRVLTLLCEGLQNKEISSRLNIEETTVKMDVKSICRKMDVRNRTQAVIKAIKTGIY